MKISPTFTFQTVLANFGPWIVYGLLAATGRDGWACVGGLAVLLCQGAFQRRFAPLKIMDAVSLLFFFIGAIVTLVLHSSLFLRDGTVLLWIALSVVAWGSLLVHSPFTAEYARDSVPEDVWNSPGFRWVNLIITAAWGTVFTLSAVVSALIALHPSWLSGQTKTWVGAVPYAGVLFGIVFTNRFPQWASEHWGSSAPVALPKQHT